MKLKSRKFGLLTQAVLASSVVACLATPFSVIAAGIDVGADETIGGGAVAPGDWVRFTADVELITDAGPNNTLAASDGATLVVITKGLSAATDGTADHGIIKVNDAAGFSPAGGLGEAGAKNALNKLYFDTAASTTELKADAYFANSIDFNNQAATLKLSPQVVGTPLIISAADITSTGGNKGTITVDDSVANTQVNFVGTIGAAAKKPTLFNVGAGAAAVTAYVQGDVDLSAGQIKIFDQATLKVADTINVIGPIDGGAAGNGTLLFEGQSAVSGVVGATKLALVDVAGADIVDFDNNVTATKTTIANGGTLRLADGKTIASIIDGAGASEGTLDFKGDGTSSVGAVGAASPLNLITVDSAGAGGKTVTFSGGDVSATTINVVGKAAGNSTVAFTSANNTVTAAFTTSIHQQNIIDFTNTDVLNGDIGALNKEFAQVRVVENGDMTLNGNVWAQDLHLKANKALSLGDSFNINGPVTTETDTEGTLKFLGDSVVGGQIGAGGGSLDLVSTNGLGKTVQLAHDIFATDTQLFDTSTLKITADGKSINGNFEAKGAGSTLNIGANTFNVTGTAKFGAGDTLSVILSDAGNGELVVTGAATVDAASKLAIDTSGRTNTGYIKADTITLIQAAAGSALVALPVTELDASAILGFATEVDATGQFLQLIVTRNGLDNPVFNPGPQGGGVASALETAGANGQLTQGLQDLMTNLQNLDTDGEVTTALQTLAPNISGGAIQGSVAAVDAGVGVLNERMEVARSGVGSYNRGMSAGDVFDNDMGLWAQVVGSDFKQDLRGGVAGYDGNNLGAMFGVDWKLTDELLFGVAAGYGTTDIDFDLAGSTLNIDTWQASAYGSWSFNDPWFVDGMIGFAHHSYDQRRNIILPPALATALANYNGWEWVAHVRAGYEHQEGDWYITPAVSLKYANLSIDDYNETNAGAANLSVSNKDVDGLIAGLGVKVEYRAGMFAPEAHASAYYDFNASRQETNNLFLGSTVGFATTGVKPAHESYEVGAGLNVYAMDQLQLNLHYDYSFKSDFHSHTGFFKIRYEW